MDIRGVDYTTVPATILLLGYMAMASFFPGCYGPLRQKKWQGLEINEEKRCSKFERKKHYPYSQSLEMVLYSAYGEKFFSPYDKITYKTKYETDIEHIVAAAEAHDSGLCAADLATRRAFASDLDNLTLAYKTLNRHKKSDKDAAEWLPEHNKCWFVWRIISVKKKYGLSIDRDEQVALKSVLDKCEPYPIRGL